MKHAVRSIVLLALGVAACPLPGTAVSAEAMPDGIRKWEYRVLTKDQVLDLGKKNLEAGLNKLGEEGWELAAVDGAYIFKRSREPNRRRVEEIKQQIAMLESDLELLKDRAAWAERMARKGFFTDRQAEVERLRLKRAELALDRARKELQSLSPELKGTPAKEDKPAK
jgi:hypothetical protein